MAFGSIRKLKSGRFQARYTYRGQECKAPTLSRPVALLKVGSMKKKS